MDTPPLQLIKAEHWEIAEAWAEEMRSKLAALPPRRRDSVIGGLPFARFLWHELFREALGKAFWWLHFRRIYKRKSYLFKNWVEGRGDFFNACRTLYAICIEQKIYKPR